MATFLGFLFVASVVLTGITNKRKTTALLAEIATYDHQRSSKTEKQILIDAYIHQNKCLLVARKNCENIKWISGDNSGGDNHFLLTYTENNICLRE